MILLFIRNICAANVHWSQLSESVCHLASCYLFMFNCFVISCNIVLAQFCNLCSGWQIQVTCLHWILYEAPQIFYWGHQNALSGFWQILFGLDTGLKGSQMSVQDKCSELPITSKMLVNVEKKKIERFHLDDSWTINYFSITGISYGVCYNVLVWELSDTTLYSMHLCLEFSQDILCDQLAPNNAFIWVLRTSFCWGLKRWTKSRNID